MSQAESLSKEIVQFLKEQQKYDLLPSVVELLEKEVYRNHDIHVTLATDLSSEEANSLRTVLTQKWGEHQIIMDTDPSLLSGMIIAFNGTVIDTSGRKKMASLKQTLS